MTAETVIQRGESIPSSLAFFQATTMSNGMIILAAGVLLMVLSFVLRALLSSTKITPTLRTFVYTLTIVGLVVATMIVLVINHNDNEQQADAYTDAFYAWVIDDVTAYAESSDYTDRELVSIEYVKDRDDRNIPVVKYTGESGITETLEQPTAFNTAVKLVYDVKPGDAEFVRFYEIEHDLGHGFTPGEYGLTVHLHEKE